MSKKTTSKKTNKTKKSNMSSNPLFVVTNKGKVVEAANGPLEALIKKFGLEGTVELIKGLLQTAFETVKSYATLQALTEYFDKWVAELQKVAQTIDDLSVPIIKKVREVLGLTIPRPANP